MRGAAVLQRMRGLAGPGNGDGAAAANGKGQKYLSGCRLMRGGDRLHKRMIQQISGQPSCLRKGTVSHQRHLVLFHPGQQIVFNPPGGGMI